VNEQASFSLFPLQAAMASEGGLPAPVEGEITEAEAGVCATDVGTPMDGAVTNLVDGLIAALAPVQADSSNVTRIIRYKIFVFIFILLFSFCFFLGFGNGTVKYDIGLCLLIFWYR
jgi:hypothetical protein